MGKIEKLEEENEKLRETLKEIYEVLSKDEPKEAIEKAKRLVILANLE